MKLYFWEHVTTTWLLSENSHLVCGVTVTTDETLKLTPWCRIFFEKLIAYFLYKTRRFITVFTTVCSWSISWNRFVQSAPPNPIILRSIIMLFSHLLLFLPISLPFKLPNQNIVRISHLSRACYMIRPSHHLWLDHPIAFGETYNSWSSSLCSLL